MYIVQKSKTKSIKKNIHIITQSNTRSALIGDLAFVTQVNWRWKRKTVFNISALAVTEKMFKSENSGWKLNNLSYMNKMIPKIENIFKLGKNTFGVNRTGKRIIWNLCQTVDQDTLKHQKHSNPTRVVQKATSETHIGYVTSRYNGLQTTTGMLFRNDNTGKPANILMIFDVTRPEKEPWKMWNSCRAAGHATVKY